MSTSHILIQGIPVPSGQAPGLRKEFSEWATNSPQTSIQVSLFIRALRKFYEVPYDQTLSYFQVAGIHGYPGNLVWDNSAPPSHQRDRKHKIYCTHNLLTFPTWHRAYMLLFEQAIYEFMGKVIEDDLQFHSDADKQAWIDESTMWRLPYWDWANPNKGSAPTLFMPASVNIRVPAKDGSQPAPENVPNPLYRYQLKVDGLPKKMGDLPKPYTVDSVKLTADGKELVLPWAQCSGTSRWGINSTNEQDWSDGVNNTKSIEKAIQSHIYYGPKPGNDIYKHPVSDLVYRLLSGVPTWANFATAATNDPSDTIPWQEWISLEYVHNNLHGFIGGDNLMNGIGHMQNVPSAAFDPIFYMHHCNIDRLLAIWQTLNPNSWFASDASPPSTDPLPPFHHMFETGKVDYFNSDDLYQWSTYGYQYDVLERKTNESDAVYLARIKTYVEKTYKNNTGQLLLDDPDKLFKGFKAQGDTYDDYIIDVCYDRYALDGEPYTIHFYLGAVINSEVSAGLGTGTFWTFPSHVGSVYNFSSPTGGAADEDVPYCANCAQQHDDGVLSRAQVPLTIPLYRAAVGSHAPDIQFLTPDHVEPYLSSQLSWVAVSANGIIIPWDRLSKTKIFVLKGKAKHYFDETRLSNYSDYEPMPNVTHAKAAGASPDDYSRAV